MESQIREIQEKYWSGKSSVEEERILKDQFNKDESVGLESKYFKHLVKESQEKYSVEFNIPTRRITFPIRIVAAAVVAILLGSAYLFQTTRDQNEFAVNDPQQAFLITKNALMAVSTGINKGTSYTDNLEKFNKAQEIISN